MPTDILQALLRCDQEIQEILNREGEDKAYLRVLGICDWEHEKRLILKEKGCVYDPQSETPDQVLHNS
jgi:hypothetical protein